MYDLMKANKIYHELKMENPNYDSEMVEHFKEKMPYEFAKMMYHEKYGCHILEEEDYLEGISYITDNKDNKIEMWKPEDIKKIASNFITIEDEKFKEYDLYLWANVKKADTYGIESDPVKIIKMAIADLKDKDFPYYPPEERAYKWLEAHREKK